MTHASAEGRVFDLTDPDLQHLENVDLNEARRRVASGDPSQVDAIRGSFALVAQEGIRVRMARTLDRPLRFFLAKKADGPILIAADRIDALQRFLGEHGIADQFHPSYSRMVPAHYIMEVELRGCPDPFPRCIRYFAPERGTLPQDLPLIGTRYMQALEREITEWLVRIPHDQPVGIAFSGGIDSGSVLLLAHHIMTERKLNPARLKAFTLCVDGRGEDLEQARAFLERVGLALYHEPVEVSSSSLDPLRTIRVIEDYKPLDVESATVAIALLEGIRHRYPDWKYLLDGDGGDENLKDYPIEENPELTIRSVLSNLMLYQEGWGVGSLKHSLTYSGGQSRSYVRTYAPARTLGFEGFSPYTRREVIRVAEAIPFIELTDWSVPALYALKGDIVAHGVKEVTGIEMPVFPKRRFQRGSVDSSRFDRIFSGQESTYRTFYMENGR